MRWIETRFYLQLVKVVGRGNISLSFSLFGDSTNVRSRSFIQRTASREFNQLYQ
jgi:hypothetical protein